MGLYLGDVWAGGWVRLRLNWSCSKAAAGKMNLYESFAQATQLGDLHTCLMMDMKACQEDDVRLLCHLTPSIYTEVSSCLCPCGWGAVQVGSRETALSRCTKPVPPPPSPLASLGLFFPHHSRLLLLLLIKVKHF